MLILSRKAEQRIQIGEDIVLTVCEIRGETVRLGIEAPRDVRIVRDELIGGIPEDVLESSWHNENADGAAPNRVQ